MKSEIKYQSYHDINWLLGIVEELKFEYPQSDYSKGYNRALNFISELITKGMIKEDNK